MFKKFIVFLGISNCALFLSGCSLKKTPAALQINTNPSAVVFVDGKQIGKTPYQGNDWKEGEYTVKLIPESADAPLSSWESKLRLSGGVLTLVERDFAATEAGASGQILSLEKTKDKKTASMTIVSDPDGALVYADGEAKGFTPITVDQVGVGDHQITVSKEGYAERLVKAKTVDGYKLIVNVKLAQEGQAVVTPTPPQTSETGGSLSSESNKEGFVEFEVEINETPTGWLRVRNSASTTGAEVAKVNPGEKYTVLEEKSGWYKIEYEQDKEGWVAGQYTKKL
ncbi:MAG: PEGA domain-containing protein [Patescibacteria group bacterium]|jgi:hypothetical protein